MYRKLIAVILAALAVAYSAISMFNENTAINLWLTIIFSAYVILDFVEFVIDKRCQQRYNTSNPA